MRVFHLSKGPVRTVAYAPDGRRLAAGGDDRIPRIVESDSECPPLELDPSTDSVRGLAFSPDGKKLAVASWDNSVHEWNLRSRKRIASIDQLHGGAWTVIYSHSGDDLITGDGHGTLVIRSVSLPNPLRRRTPAGTIYALACSPDDRWIAAGRHDRTISLWDTNWQTRKKPLSGHTDWVYSVAFSPDGSLLASSAADGRILIFNLQSRKIAASWQEHTGPVARVAFLPHGRSLLSVGWDGTVREWDVATGRPLSAYTWQEGRMLCLAVSPDGMTAAAGCETGAVVVWDLE